MRVLRVDASARSNGSHTKALTDRLISGFGSGASVHLRDLGQTVPHIDDQWVAANDTPEVERSPEQKAALAFSDTLVQELQAADVVVIGLPVYNFGVPAALKAWVDQICRARLTFTYRDGKQMGLLTGKRAVIVYASGGTPMGSSIDFASGYLRHILGFVGIDDVEFVNADQLMFDPEKPQIAAAEADRVAMRIRTNAA